MLLLVRTCSTWRAVKSPSSRARCSGLGRLKMVSKGCATLKQKFISYSNARSAGMGKVSGEGGSGRGPGQECETQEGGRGRHLGQGVRGRREWEGPGNECETRQEGDPPPPPPPPGARCQRKARAACRGGGAHGWPQRCPLAPHHPTAAPAPPVRKTSPLAPSHSLPPLLCSACTTPTHCTDLPGRSSPSPCHTTPVSRTAALSASRGRQQWRCRQSQHEGRGDSSSNNTSSSSLPH